jgi:serine protease Do
MINVYEENAPTVVVVSALLENGPSAGTGVIIDKTGLVLTSNHVMKNAKLLSVTMLDEKTYAASILATNLGANQELALLKIELPENSAMRFPVAKLADSQTIKVGQKVLAIGNPFGLERTLTLGIISRLDKKNQRIQTDAPLNPGNSGGPLLNTNGEVIGINQAIFNPSGFNANIGIGFATPINDIKPYLRPTILNAFVPMPAGSSSVKITTQNATEQQELPVLLKP